MSSHFEIAVKQGKINPPKWLSDNIHYEVIMGSHAYGVSNDDSDFDMYGWCIPPKDQIFPHLAGYIEGFGPVPEMFKQFQQHHVFVGTQEHDFTIFSVAKYLHLVIQNNPNMIDSMFVPFNCITKITKTGQIIHEKRREFLHRGAYVKFKSYASSQLHKLDGKSANSANPERKQTVEEFGYDVKFAYHLVRLLNECEQILTTHNINLQRDREQLKEVRRGDWSIERLHKWVEVKNIQLEELFGKTTLREEVDFEFAKSLLLNVIEEQYGSVSQMISRTQQSESDLVRELEALVNKYR